MKMIWTRRYPYITSRHFQSGIVRYLVFVSCVALVSFVGATFSQCAIQPRPKQIERNPGEIFPLIKDNTVVFLGISQKDYDMLVKQKPEVADIIEELGDYYHYARMVELKLTSLGYTVLYGSWHRVEVQIERGKTRMMAFDPADVRAILMKAKGKDPVLVTNFLIDYYFISKLISDYFSINLGRVN